MNVFSRIKIRLVCMILPLLIFIHVAIIAFYGHPGMIYDMYMVANGTNAHNSTGFVNSGWSLNTSLQPCPELPPDLVGPLKMVTDPLPWDKLESSYPDVWSGGWWRPRDCLSRHHVAIIIPYRDREEHLRVFLHHVIPIFQRQMLDYRIFVIEQNNGSTFNRGLLFNIGFTEAMKVDTYSCVVLSDVDLLPENDKNIYGCAAQPRHLSVLVNTLKYTLPYSQLLGGVVNFRVEHFRNINGFSNVYFGWGAEDDDLYSRTVAKGYKLTRPSDDVSRFTMIGHAPQAMNKNRYKTLYQWKSRMNHDGLNSLDYKISRYEKRPLYTLISVNIDQQAVLSKSMRVPPVLTVRPMPVTTTTPNYPNKSETVTSTDTSTVMSTLPTSQQVLVTNTTTIHAEIGNQQPGKQESIKPDNRTAET